MATRAEATAVKSEVRRKLRQLGMVVVSIGVESAGSGARISVGVASDLGKNAGLLIVVHNVPVRLFQQSFGTLAAGRGRRFRRVSKRSVRNVAEVAEVAEVQAQEA